MKKLLIGLLTLGSLSAVAQTVIVGNLIENLENRGPGILVKTKFEVKGNYTDEGDTVLLLNLYFQDKNDGGHYGIRRKHQETICQRVGFREQVKGTASYKRKNLFVIKNSGFIQRGPNRVLDSIECKKP